MCNTKCRPSYPQMTFKRPVFIGVFYLYKGFGCATLGVARFNSEFGTLAIHCLRGVRFQHVVPKFVLTDKDDIYTIDVSSKALSLSETILSYGSDTTMSHIVSANIPGHDSIDVTFEGGVTLKPDAMLDVHVSVYEANGLNVLLETFLQVTRPGKSWKKYVSVTSDLDLRTLVSNRALALDTFAGEDGDLLEACLTHILRNDGRFVIACTKEDDAWRTDVSLVFDNETYPISKPVDPDLTRTFLDFPNSPA